MWKLQEYHRLGEAGLSQDGRYELLNGEIVEMSPVGIELESQQPLVVGDDEPVPDVFLLRPSPDFYEGAGSSLQEVKVPKYAQHRVPEVWVGDRVWF